MKKIQLILVAAFLLSHLSMVSQEISNTVDSVYIYSDQKVSYKEVVKFKSKDGDTITSNYISINPDGSEELDWITQYEFENKELKKLNFTLCLDSPDTCFLDSVIEYTNNDEIYREVGPAKWFILYNAGYSVVDSILDITGFHSDSLVYNSNGRVVEVYKIRVDYPSPQYLTGKRQYFWSDEDLADSIYYFDGNLNFTGKIIYKYNENRNIEKRCYYNDSLQLTTQAEYFYDEEFRFVKSKSSRLGVEDTTYVRHEYYGNVIVKHNEKLNPAGEQISGNFIEEYYFDDLLTLDSTANYNFDSYLMQHELGRTKKYFNSNSSDLTMTPNPTFFVNSSNTWYIDECGTGVSNGITTCRTHQYYFGDSVTIDSKEYKKLITEDLGPYDFFNRYFPEYYREKNKRVYAIDLDYSDDEFLVYDFNLEVGDQIEVGDENFNYVIKVISIDSIELYSGEKRKRMEIGYVGGGSTTTYWIEGIGSVSSPLDTRHMFSSHFEIFWDLNCFLVDSDVEYSLDDCELSTSTEDLSTDVELTVFPNPSSDGKLNFISKKNKEIDIVEIYSTKGNLVLSNKEVSLNSLNIDDLVSGIYFLKIRYIDASYELAKFVKN